MDKSNKPTPAGEEKIVYQGKIVEVVEQDMQIGSKRVSFEYARRAPGTRLIIVSPKDKILLTKEYRHELEDWDYRLPGGKVFDTLNAYNEFLRTDQDILEPATKAAKKEAEEEAGIKVGSIEHLETAHCGATMIWDLFYFLVSDYKNNSAGQDLEQGEEIDIEWVSFERAGELAIKRDIQENRSAAVLLRYLSFLD